MTELIADVKEWERRMHLREFFFDQNHFQFYVQSSVFITHTPEPLSHGLITID
jgi:hypothetical protein